MSGKLLTWLKMAINPPPRRAAPSPFVRKVKQAFKLLLLLLLCGFVVWRVWLYFEVNSRFARIRAAGLPTSGAELNGWPGLVPDAENGALVLTQAFALLRTFPDSRSNQVFEPRLLSRTNQWSPQTRALIAEYVQTNAAALAQAREALRLSRFRFPVDYTYGPDTEMPHLLRLKQLARAAAFQAALLADDGRTNGWPQHVEFQLQLAGTLDREPALLSHLARGALISLAVEATERSLNRGSSGDEACRQLQAAFSRAGQTNLWPLALAGERALLIPAFRMSWKEMNSFEQDDEAGGPPRKPQRYSGKPATLFWLTGFYERELNFFLGVMEKGISLAELPPPQSLALTNHFYAASDAAIKNHYILTVILLPVLSRVAVSEGTTQAQIRLAVTGLAVERFRLAHGRLPEDLRELTPEFLQAVPIDPFDGAALRYRRLGRGYVLYSVDADGHDDGGRERPRSRKVSDPSTWDIPFTVER